MIRLGGESALKDIVEKAVAEQMKIERVKFAKEGKDVCLKESSNLNNVQATPMDVYKSNQKGRKYQGVKEFHMLARIGSL